jgi:hypothetical protein
MAVSKHWKIAGAAAALAGLGIGAAAGAASGDDGTRRADPIGLRDATPLSAVPAPAPAPAPPAPVPAAPAPADLASPDGESWDSPLQSADDSPEGGDSLDSPEPVLTAPAPAPPPPPAPAPAPAPDSPASVDSWSGDSADDS